MGNTLKMEKQEIINQLIEKGWSNRKINRATEIDRRTISKYRRIRSEREKQESDSDSDKQEQTYVNQEVCNSNQNAPLSGTNKCPPTQVVRFKVPPDSSDTSGKSSKSKAAIHDKQIREKLKKGQNGKSIYQDLYAEEDYRGSYDSVKRYVRKLKRTSPKLYARIETPPGEEGQVDFGQGAPTLKNGRYLKPWLFVMTLSFRTR